VGDDDDDVAYLPRECEITKRRNVKRLDHSEDSPSTETTKTTNLLGHGIIVNRVAATVFVALSRCFEIP
jgi:hypothetical protein